LTKLSKAEQVAKMESLIEEFSLEHIRTNRGFTIWWRTPSYRNCTLATDQNSYYWMNLLRCDPVAVEDIQRIVAIKNKNIGILITDHNVQKPWLLLTKPT
jgi:lipopolysaccharide export system ATP-binding protein